MKLVIIFGPPAVGKMTVGQEIEKLTDLKLFHNHMTIELVSPFFSYGTSTGKKLVNLFRQEIFEEVSKSDLYGIIFTYVWALDSEHDCEYINNLCSLFESRGGEVYFVELEADFDERLARNKTPNRLLHKPTKRNLEWSEGNLIRTGDRFRLNSLDGEITRANYVRINNTNLSPEEVGKVVVERFGL